MFEERRDHHHPRPAPLPILISPALLTYHLAPQLAVLSALLFLIRILLVLQPYQWVIDQPGRPDQASKERFFHCQDRRDITTKGTGTKEYTIHIPNLTCLPIANVAIERSGMME